MCVLEMEIYVKIQSKWNEDTNRGKKAKAPPPHGTKNCHIKQNAWCSSLQDTEPPTASTYCWKRMVTTSEQRGYEYHTYSRGFTTTRLQGMSMILFRVLRSKNQNNENKASYYNGSMKLPFMIWLE